MKKDPSFKPSILSQIDSLEELGSDAQGMYRMMRSLERRGLVARLLHRRPAVWYDISSHEGTQRLEQREHGWYDYNYVRTGTGRFCSKLRTIDG